MPITISVCDDDEGQLGYLSELLFRWSDSREIPININKYKSAEAFLFAYPEQPCSLLLLDIEMEELNGMELAKKLRSEGDMLPLLFITGYSEYMNEGYEVEALHYLLKPVDTEKLFAVLDKYVRNRNENDSILLECEDGEDGIIRRISPDEIVYCEADGKKSLVCLRDGSRLVCSLGISGLKEKLSGDFISCHRSYAVNLRYVKGIAKTDIILDSGKKIPLSRRLYNEVNECFIKFYTGKR